MSDLSQSQTPTPSSTRTLLIHSLISLSALTITGVACAYFNLPSAFTGTLIAAVVAVLIASGMMTATASAATQSAASVVSTQLTSAIQDLADKHAENAKAIAVHDAKILAVTAPVTPILNLMTEPASVIEPK